MKCSNVVQAYNRQDIRVVVRDDTIERNVVNYSQLCNLASPSRKEIHQLSPKIIKALFQTNTNLITVEVHSINDLIKQNFYVPYTRYSSR